MAKSQSDIATENGKPTKGERAPVIRRVFMNEEDTASRVLNRHVPAWVISGGIHVLLIGAFVLLYKGDDTKANGSDEDKIVATKIDEKEVPPENFQNEALGLDAELESATASPREEKEVVEGPTVTDEAIGSPTESMEQPTQTFAPMGLGATDLLAGSNANLNDLGAGMKGDLGGGTPFQVPGMKGRSGATKERLLREGGGNTDTEAAVSRALAWIAKQQKTDGHWTFVGDGSSKDDIAATGMAVLPFLAAGYTHKPPSAAEREKKDKKDYSGLVSKAVAWMSGKQGANGQFVLKDVSTNYTQGIATIVFCELYGMTKDPNVKDRAQKALNYICSIQEKNGGWGYQAKDPTSTDTSIVGWQVQALRSGRTAELSVPVPVLDKAVDFLKFVSSAEESKYGYRTKADPSHTQTSIGLLCRQYMGWGPSTPSLAKGVDFLLERQPAPEIWDMYYYYYATQVAHFFEGKVWHDTWNPKMKRLLLDKQEKAGANAGSFQADTSHIGSSCGRLGTTCMATLTLEVYYRHLPLYKREKGGAERE